MINSIYSDPIRKAIRIICLLAVLILSLGIYLNYTELKTESLAYLKLLQNLVVAVLTIILFIFPTKLFLIAAISYQYSLAALYSEPNEMMAVYMFFLSIAVLFVRGFFNKHKWIKLIALTIPIVAMQMSEIRFDNTIFIDSTINKVAHSFVMLLIIFFIFIYSKNQTNPDMKNLNLAIYPTLKKRDAEWLIHIQNNQKYDWIAIEYNMSAGSVKNRLKLIFNTLEVGDKTGFLNKYSDYRVYYDESEINNLN